MVSILVDLCDEIRYATNGLCIRLPFVSTSLAPTLGIDRAVNRTVYGYGRTPYGKYTASGRTVWSPYP